MLLSCFNVNDDMLLLWFSVNVDVMFFVVVCFSES